MAYSAQPACYITGANVCARWHVVGVSTNVSRTVVPVGPGCTPSLVLFFKPVFGLFRVGATVRPFMLSRFDAGLLKWNLLFSRNDVAKEFVILRKWTKKMSKNRTRRNTFGKIRRVYIINGPKGLKKDAGGGMGG